MPRKLKLMPGFAERQAQKHEALDERRWRAPLGYARSVAADTARRVDESRKVFGWKFYRGDCHAHSQHSDGIGTVEEIAETVKAAGLDFQFVTDHWGVTQASECRRHGLWVGQEPGTQFHHLGVLGLDHAFVPGKDLVADFVEARRLGATVYIPHPAGWWPTRVYDDQQRESLKALPAPFLMEVINGAGNIVSAWDYTDAMAVEVWDDLLMTGRRIHAMANTDAHSPHAIGIAWNGVLAARCEQSAVLKALSAGRSFASEAPLLNLSVGRAGMGQTVGDRASADAVRLKVVDSRGLLRVRLVADGKVRRTWLVDGQAVVERQVPLGRSWKRYVRIEAVSIDGRRGFSNPVYLA